MTYKIQADGQAGRVGYLDLAKGIAILSMVLCHTVTVPFTVLAWVFSFHMPIFFIIFIFFVFYIFTFFFVFFFLFNSFVYSYN